MPSALPWSFEPDAEGSNLFPTREPVRVDIFLLKRYILGEVNGQEIST